MAKRIFLFILTNILVIATVTIITQLLGLEPYIQKQGVNYESLLIFCGIWGFAGAFISLALSRVMAKMMMRVKVIPENTSEPELQWLLTEVHSLAQKAGIKKMPEVGIYDSPELNAFATGPTKNRALVAVSTGLLRRMNRSQVEGVLAHEIGHVANGDMVTMTLIQGVVNAFVMFFARVIAYAVSQNVKPEMRFIVQFSVIIVMQILFGILGSMVTAYFSRRREFRADEAGAYLAGKEKMASALEALKMNFGIPLQEENKGFQSLKISGNKSRFMSLLSTHPDIDSRIQAVRALEI